MTPEMREYLDAPHDRIGTNCEKWDGLERLYGRSDLIALWVADMDFRTVPQVREALVRRAEHAIYGYTDDGKRARAAEAGWLKRRHGLDVDPDWILYSPGVVDSLYFCVGALTGPGDGIVVQPPVYGPFYNAVRLYDRALVRSPLIREDGEWRMDFDDLEAKFAAGAKMMILCSPHNPVGRVWTRAELQRLVDLANRYGVALVSDEIHADFALDGRKQTRILALDGAERAVMLTSATKSFNLAGLRQSSIIVKDAAIRKTMERRLASGGGHTGWSRAWLICLFARLKDGQAAYGHIRELLTRSTLDNLFDTHPPFQIDGNFGGAAGIAETLLQSHEGIISLLPAATETLSGSFKGLKARGNVSVSARFQNGRVLSAELSSPIAQTVYVRIPGGEKLYEVKLKEGKTAAVTF